VSDCTDCFIFKALNFSLLPLTITFEIKCIYFVTRQGQGGGEVVGVLMDFCVTEFWMQYKFWFTYPSKKLL